MRCGSMRSPRSGRWSSTPSQARRSRAAARPARSTSWPTRAPRRSPTSGRRTVRSWVRTVLLPLVGERLGARVGHDVLRAGRAAARERRAWDSVLDHLPDLGLRIEPHRIEVARGGLARYDDVLSAALLRAAARRSGLVLGVRRARQLVELTRRPSGRRLPLGDGWMAEVAFDRLRVTRAVRDAAVEVVPTGERGSAVFGEFRVAWTPDPAPARLPRAEWTTWIAGANWEVRPQRPARLPGGRARRNHSVGARNLPEC